MSALFAGKLREQILPITHKPPDLLLGITDEYALGLSYETLDRILYRLEREMFPGAVAQELGLEPAWVSYVAGLRKAAEPLRGLPEVGPLPSF